MVDAGRGKGRGGGGKRPSSPSPISSSPSPTKRTKAEVVTRGEAGATSRPEEEAGAGSGGREAGKAEAAPWAKLLSHCSYWKKGSLCQFEVNGKKARVEANGNKNSKGAKILQMGGDEIVFGQCCKHTYIFQHPLNDDKVSEAVQISTLANLEPSVANIISIHLENRTGDSSIVDEPAVLASTSHLKDLSAIPAASAGENNQRVERSPASPTSDVSANTSSQKNNVRSDAPIAALQLPRNLLSLAPTKVSFNRKGDVSAQGEPTDFCEHEANRKKGRRPFLKLDVNILRQFNEQINTSLHHMANAAVRAMEDHDHIDDEEVVMAPCLVISNPAWTGLKVFEPYTGCPGSVQFEFEFGQILCVSDERVLFKQEEDIMLYNTSTSDMHKVWESRGHEWKVIAGAVESRLLVLIATHASRPHRTAVLTKRTLDSHFEGTVFWYDEGIKNILISGDNVCWLSEEEDLVIMSLGSDGEHQLCTHDLEGYNISFGRMSLLRHNGRLLIVDIGYSYPISPRLLEVHLDDQGELISCCRTNLPGYNAFAVQGVGGLVLQREGGNQLFIGCSSVCDCYVQHLMNSSLCDILRRCELGVIGHSHCMGRWMLLPRPNI